MRVRQDIDLLNAKIAAWRAEAADPANKGLVKALEIAINGAIADKLDLLKLAGEYRTSYLKEIDAYLYARIQLLRTGIDYKPFVSPTPAIILPPHHHSYRGPRRAHRTSAEFNLPARPGFGYHFEVEHDPRPRRLHKARKRSGTEMRNRAEPVEHLPSASSTDLETGETTTSQGNGDGTRTVTKTDKRGKAVSKKVRGKKLSKKKRKLRKVKMNKKRFKKLNKRKLRKSKRFKRNKRSAKRMNRRMRMKQRGFRKMRRTRRNRG
ncbi:MAG: hypothetical protein HKN11_05485 [Rhizobiales bacterium]|nr:hypothetical protein [Hyphomicrobiales bacterium]